MVVVIFVVFVVFADVVIDVITVMMVVDETVVVVLDVKGISVVERIVDLRVDCCDSVVIMKEKLDKVLESCHLDVK